MPRHHGLAGLQSRPSLAGMVDFRADVHRAWQRDMETALPSPFSSLSPFCVLPHCQLSPLPPSPTRPISFSKTATTPSSSASLAPAATAHPRVTALGPHRDLSSQRLWDAAPGRCPTKFWRVKVFNIKVQQQAGRVPGLQGFQLSGPFSY